jgi:uncharacterized protein
VVQADDGVQLVGELVVPGAPPPWPAALLLSGSGPLDGDSNMPEQVLNVMNAFAAALAAHGVASLRFDKRGVCASGGDYLTTSFERETADAKAALGALRGGPGIDVARVTAVGHSLGGTIAIRLAAASESLAGVVLLSTPATSGEEVMRWQSERIAASLHGLARLRRGSFLRNQQRVRSLLLASTGDTVSIHGVEMPARWFREVMAYEPVPDLRAIRCPVLAIVGRNDVQVDAEDIERMRGLVVSPFEGEAPTGLTHLLRSHARPGLDAYADQMKEPPDAWVLERVASWVSVR